MSDVITITVLVENTTDRPDLTAEHGLSYWIDVGDRRILFDAAQGKALFPNARRLGIDLATVDAIAISHGHYDHTGGLPSVLETARPSLFVGHPDVFRPKFARRKNGSMADVGMGDVSEAALRSACRKVVLTREPHEVAPGVWFSGEIARTTAFEDTGGPFFADRNGHTRDPLRDDAALILDAAEGLVVLLGCAHSGVINTLHHARKMIDGKPVTAVIGGMHLQQASKERLEATIEGMRRQAVARIAAGHCTGEQVCRRFAEVFGKRFLFLSAGEQFRFDRL
jgi:7,8-dihydropterin-6-yl-methyl-4-(beta-D-ribofuranosyl)aminobenzene 5'-phosphate synthase